MKTCSLCGMDFPRTQLNRYAECTECVEAADHLASEGYE
jgi:hypothetical protein